MGRLELGDGVGGLDAGPGVDEAGVPGIVVVVGAGRIGLGLAPGDAGEGRNHLAVPAGDVDQDVARVPGPEHDAAHRLVAETGDRLTQLGERGVGIVKYGGLVVHGNPSPGGGVVATPA